MIRAWKENLAPEGTSEYLNSNERSLIVNFFDRNTFHRRWQGCVHRRARNVIWCDSSLGRSALKGKELSKQVLNSGAFSNQNGDDLAICNCGRRWNSELGCGGRYPERSYRYRYGGCIGYTLEWLKESLCILYVHQLRNVFFDDVAM